jgi:Fe-S cluster biogenesis protein NfuA
VEETRVAPRGVRTAGQPAPDDLEGRRAALEAVMGLMQPAVAEDGGDLVLVDADYEAGVVRVRLEGACGSCAISSATLQGGVERILRERLAWITEVVGEVDESDAVLGTAPMGRGAYVPRGG